MQYIHYAFDPKAQGLERVADIYVFEDFDIRGRATPSSVLRSLLMSKDIPDYIRDLLQEVLQAGHSETP